MLVFDQLKKDDPQLRFIAMVVLGGLLVLLGGLWWVQVVSVRVYREKLETQSVRTVRIPPVRGKILDRNGQPLAENRPSYNVDLYVEELSKSFQKTYSAEVADATNRLHILLVQKEKELGRKLTAQEKKQFALSRAWKDEFQQQARYQVISNLVDEISTHLQVPVALTQKDFESHYLNARFADGHSAELEPGAGCAVRGAIRRGTGRGIGSAFNALLSERHRRRPHARLPRASR
jgi:cell division protein FtsI/penicillin-binding protein 2